MKKAILSVFVTLFITVAYAQDPQGPAANFPIHREKKELKRSHFSERPDRPEVRIHRGKREFHHRNGMHHDRNHRPMHRGTPRKPLIDRHR